MNKKGQALVEFIIIIPVFVMLMLAVFDYAKIMQARFDLENAENNYDLELADVILNDVNVPDEESLEIIDLEGEKKYILKKNISIYSPVLSVFMGTKYEIRCERVVYE